jgi:hypothetical protein
MSEKQLIELIELLILVLLVLAVIPVVISTVRRRGRWGINIRAVQCPQCGEPASTFRKPKNLNQALWGGGTCSKCGQEYDKWGHPAGSGPG